MVRDCLNEFNQNIVSYICVHFVEVVIFFDITKQSGRVSIGQWLSPFFVELLLWKKLSKPNSYPCPRSKVPCLEYDF